MFLALLEAGHARLEYVHSARATMRHQQSDDLDIPKPPQFQIGYSNSNAHVSIVD